MKRAALFCKAALQNFDCGARNTLYLEFPWTVVELAEAS